MNKLAIPFIPCAAVVGLMVASGMSAGAQTVIFSDNFNTADTSTFDSAPLTGRLSGVDSSLVYGQSGGAEMSISGDQLQMAGNNHAEVRFNNAGQTGAVSPYLFDWSTGSGGADILAAGGMTLSFDLTTPDTTSADNWISVSTGADNADETGAAPRVNNANNTSGILFRDTGGTAIFNNGTEYTAGEGAITPTGVTHFISINYDFTSWTAGAPVTMTAYEDGNLVGTDSFTWDYSYQYIDIGNQTTSGSLLVDNFTITTVPEPATWTMAAGGFAMLLASSRLRRLQN